MATEQFFVRQLMDGWRNYQRLLVDALRPLSAAQLALRSAPHMWSVGILAAHIVAARVYWFHHVMGEGSAELAPLRAWDDPGAPARTADELVDGLARSWALVEASSAAWSAERLAESFERRGRSGVRTFTRGWIVWHVLEHDLHHGGELSQCLGQHGVAALDL